MAVVAEPWDDERVAAFGTFLEAYAAVVGRIEGDLHRTIGVPITWFEVLVRLARAPERRLRMAELARRVGLSTSGLTRLVDRIEAAGHVRRESCATDGRGAHAVLTEHGEALLRRALPSQLECIEAHLAGPLGPELTTFERLLRTVRDHGGPGDRAAVDCGPS
jgi:MarR family 2-MHQ and catechol resistance regulon transcriptional repressor